MRVTAHIGIDDNAYFWRWVDGSGRHFGYLAFCVTLRVLLIKGYNLLYPCYLHAITLSKFERLFKNCEKIGLDKASKISIHLAEIEKSWNLGANIEIVFII